MLSDAAIEAAFAPIADEAAVVVAVSGGPDSLALLLIAGDWAKRHPNVALFAATVDHGLRPESAEEASQVARQCAELGVPHAILAWRGDKPKTRLQERAREARYRLLSEEAKRRGARFVLTAHHADDQAETVLFRMARGSGVAGLAGMARIANVEGLALFRPLLDAPKRALLALCAERGVAPIDDPSNRDEKFARARLRKILPTLAAEGMDAAAFARLARRLRRADEALQAETQRLLRRLGDGPNYIGAHLLESPPEIALRALATLLARATPQPRPSPSLEALEALEAGLRAALKDNKRFRANLGGAELVAAADGRIRAGAEAPRRLARP